MTIAQRRALWVIIGIGFALRLGWAIYARAEPPVEFYKSGDQFSYYYYGQEIARGRGYVSYTPPFHATAYYPIGYPAILGVFYFVLLHSPLHAHLFSATLILNVVVATASLPLVFVVGRALGTARTGLVAAGIMAVFPGVIFQVATLQLETMFIFLLLVSLAIIVTHDWELSPPTHRRLAAFGISLGVAALVRPFALVLVAGLLAALAVQRQGWRKVLASVGLVVGVIVAMSIPWTIRNAGAMHAFVPSSTNMGDTLCLDRNLDAKGGFRFSGHDGCVDPALGEVARNSGNTRKAIEFVTEHPGRELLQIVRRARIMFGGDHDGLEAVQSLGNGPFLSERVLDVATPVADWVWFGVVAVAAIGLPTFAERSARPQRLIVLSGLVGLLVIPLLLWGNQRFHLPLAPFLALSAAGAVVWVVDRRAQRVS